MIIYPAIDLIDGQAVRLTKGDYEQKTVFGNDPCAIACEFASKGATRVHLVDLMGAKDSGMPAFDLVCDIKKASGLFCEIGGGIRSMDAIDCYLNAGIDRVILGTAAAEDPDFARQAIELYGKHIAIGIDIKDGKVATRGWTELTDYTLDSFIELMKNIACPAIICTDVSKDGVMSGVNMQMYKQISETYEGELIASGGVCDLDDVKSLSSLNLHGVIIGKALYIGAIDLEDALAATNE